MTVGFAFDGTNATAQAVALRAAALLVREVSEETKGAIRRHISESIRTGVAPVEAARRISQLIGLTERQMMAVSNFRDGLTNAGLIPSRVDAAVNRYAKKKLRERAVNIARTETMGALNRGWVAGMKQAQEEGFLAKDAEAVVLTTPDERRCKICAPREGRIVSLDDSSNHPIFHPSCRCSLGISIEAKP